MRYKNLYSTLAVCCLLFIMPQSSLAAAHRQEHVIKQVGKQVGKLEHSETRAYENILYGVSAINKNDIWAAGYTGNFDSYQYSNKIMKQWNGTQWLNRQMPASEMYGITTLSMNNAYAVGEIEGDYIIHWDGTNWKAVYESSKGILFAVSAVNKDDIWAAGTYEFLHWDGKGWQSIGDPGITIHGLSAIAKDNVWAVGSDENQHAIIQHWNGHQWNLITNPIGEKFSSLSAISALDAHTIWAVGEERRETLVLFWNGQRWQRVTSTNPAINYDTLTGISIIDKNNAWAVGDYQEDSCLYYCELRTLVEHWNGKNWQQVKSPDFEMHDNVLYGVVALSKQDVWAVGSEYAGYDFQHVGHTLALHWNGKGWQRFYDI